MRPILQTLVASLTFLTTVGMLRPHIAVSTGIPKLEHFEAHASEYDAVFLGSSRTFRSIVPSAFEERLAERGMPLRVFNFGLGGMGSFESEAFLRRILAADGARLSWVFIEPNDFGPSVPEYNRRSPRMVRWHTPGITWMALRTSLEHKGDLSERFDLAKLHLELFGMWLTSIGQAPNRARSLLGMTPPPNMTLDQVRETSGYQPLEEDPDAAPRREALLRDPGEFAERVKGLIPGVTRKETPTAATRRSFLGQVKRIRDAGAEPIFVIPPVTVVTATQRTMGRKGDLPTLFAFNDPRKFPRFYRIGCFFDMNHLNQEAATEFSMVLAEQFADYVASAKPARKGEPVGTRMKQLR